MLALDVLNELADRLRWPQMDTIENATLTKQQRKLLRLMNTVLKAMSGTNDWPMMRKEGTIVLVASELSDTTSGTEQYVTATQNSDTITIANMTALNQSYIGRAIQVSTDQYIYRIVDVPSASTLKLNRAWVSDSITAADEATFTIAVDRYALPDDFDRPTDSFESFFAPYGIEPIGVEEFQMRRRRRGYQMQLDEPSVYTVFGLNEGQTAEILHFDPWPESARMLVYTYIQVHPDIDSDNDKILFPPKYREVIIETILQLALRDYEDSAKAQATLNDLLRQYNQLMSAPSVTEQALVIRPDKSIRQSIRRSFGNGGLRVNWGTTFDNVDATGLD